MRFPAILQKSGTPECDTRRRQAALTEQLLVPSTAVMVLYKLLRHTGCDTAALKRQYLTIFLLFWRLRDGNEHICRMGQTRPAFDNL